MSYQFIIYRDSGILVDHYLYMTSLYFRLFPSQKISQVLVCDWRFKYSVYGSESNSRGESSSSKNKNYFYQQRRQRLWSYLIYEYTVLLWKILQEIRKLGLSHCF